MPLLTLLSCTRPAPPPVDECADERPTLELAHTTGAEPLAAAIVTVLRFYALLPADVPGTDQAARLRALTREPPGRKASVKGYRYALHSLGVDAVETRSVGPAEAWHLLGCAVAMIRLEPPVATFLRDWDGVTVFDPALPMPRHEARTDFDHQWGSRADALVVLDPSLDSATCLAAYCRLHRTQANAASCAEYLASEE